ncbi:MAG: hypothetical protein AAF184_16450 [Pseudomonadota bacterium]
MSNYPILRRLVSLLSLLVFSVTMVAFARAFATPNTIVEPGGFPAPASVVAPTDAPALTRAPT